MALDKLVDSTKLDACLDAEADAIRAKTGGSADIPFDFANNKGFADAIAAIPSGGGGGLQSDEVTSIMLSNVKFTSNPFVVNMPNANLNLQDFVRQTAASETNTIIDIRCKSVTSMYRAFSSTTKISTIIFNLSNAKYINIDANASEMTRSSSVKRIIGTYLKLATGQSTATNYDAIWDVNEFYLVPNVRTNNFTIAKPTALIDATIISIANSLKAENPNTLTLSSNSKARLSAIVGIVTHKTYNEIMETEEEFDFFTADENGTVTLLDFITNTKGWTVA